MNKNRRARKKVNRSLAGRAHEHTEGVRCGLCRPVLPPRPQHGSWRQSDISLLKGLLR
jgi:hypothetical protein